LKLPILIVALFMSCFCLAQNTPDYENLYPNDDAVTTSLKRHIDISDRRGNLSIKEEVSKSVYFVTNNRLSIANESVNYNTFNSLVAINAKTENFEQGSSTYSDVKKFAEKNVLINGIFFNDQKEKSFTFPNVKKGSQTHLNYTKKITDPHFLPAFIISERNPVEKIELSISFPSTVDVAYKSFNLDDIDSNFEEITEGNITTYKWVLNSIPRINNRYDFSPLYYIPQIITYIKSYNRNGNKINILSDPSDLYSWYTKLTSNINKTDQSELKTITMDLIDGAKNDEDKIKRIYYYIQNEINYIAFEDGLNGFIPRDAKNVFSKKYGDCKDMANILNEMLRYAGISSYLTWIGTRKKPYSYNEVPTPITDNHMITAVKIGENFSFLDATAKYLTFGLPSPNIQGKEALIGLSKTDFKILKVPEIDASKNKIKVLSELALLNDKLIGKHEVEVSGYGKLEMLHKIERKADDDLDFLHNTLKIGTKKTTIDSIKYNNLELEKESLNIIFNSSTSNYTRIIDGDIYLKPNLDFHLKSEIVKKEDKDFDKKIDHKFQKTFITTFKIPEGHTIKIVPKNSQFSNESFKYHIHYSLSEDNAILNIEKQIEVNTLKITTQQMDKWNDFIKSLNKANKQSIIITKD